MRRLTDKTNSVSWQARWLAAALRYTIRPVLHLGTYLLHLPLPTGVVDSLARFVMVPPRGTVREPLRLNNCGAELVRAVGVAPADGSGRAILYLHGGAFIACGLNTHARIVSTLSRQADAPVLSVDYRMAPKSPMSAAVQDSVDGYRWLLARGYRPDQIVVAGDSAGGYLSFMVALTMISEGHAPPAGIVAMSPLTELDSAPKLAHRNSRSDAVFTRRCFTALHQLVTKANARVLVDGVPGPLIEPTAEDLTRMPPTLIHASASEGLLHDAELMTERLRVAGVPVELKTWAGQVHVFQAAELFVPEARQSLSELSEFILEVTERAGLSATG
ncbi:alpha/beta hydrolase [Antrihabitans stalactiti]|uniref:Alpha/beta hydrolase n=1 Tax=Antrihabitans stalactiti TaxID=2584121 RepID=A0A848KH71_9NOCA|nr:alpha/beta hydrolase [Antrihabitans stalactiti]NMN95540.1 alpha/beta hydrolase [Antrihabitans stalactiti]